ncbi:MAG: AAA family ATPase, partial [Gaiellales bacterium]
LVEELSLFWSIVASLLIATAFRGLVDVGVRKWIPGPSLYGEEDESLKEEDVIARRRAHFWSKTIRWGFWIGLVVTIVWLIRGGSWTDALLAIPGALGSIGPFALILPFLFLVNFLILFGPLVFMGISQIRSYEPGDADWGVALDHVRGQAEAKEEVRRVVTLWQSGDAFEQAGGKRERGLLMLGAPGTGKTMMSKAIATNFNAPFLSIPGSGFAQTFIGMDVVIVRFLAAKAKRMARKWGGQAIVFIDEIDAVGMRRQALGAQHEGQTAQNPGYHDLFFYGKMGAINPSEDLILETREWRERLFAERSDRPRPAGGRWSSIVNLAAPGMFGGGQLALNQLLVVMDGIGDPPFWRRFWTNRINTLLDASYVVPPRMGNRRLRLPKPKMRAEQIFFIGATNVPMDSLDPALTRPGRMGRHVWFRTPTKKDRLDIFNLYLDKVSHEEELDLPKRREELARITNGYSPAMIEQIASMALTLAHFRGKERFNWDDLVDAMTTIESGTAVGIEYVPEETRAVAVHEAGHAVAAHVYMKGAESTRLSIRMRGRSLGHHQALEKEERFSRWQHELMGRLIWALGAMAAERVFYGETSSGVGGDVHGATASAAMMVGGWALGPEPIELAGTFDSLEDEEEEREKVLERYERIGNRIMQRTGGGGPYATDPVASVLSDSQKRKAAAQILGQAYMKAHWLVEENRAGVEQIADALVERRELHGDEVTDMLEGIDLVVPEVDPRRDDVWPRI